MRRWESEWVRFFGSERDALCAGAFEPPTVLAPWVLIHPDPPCARLRRSDKGLDRRPRARTRPRHRSRWDRLPPPTVVWDLSSRYSVNRGVRGPISPLRSGGAANPVQANLT